jgi:hypothetical protein
LRGAPHDKEERTSNRKHETDRRRSGEEKKEAKGSGE